MARAQATTKPSGDDPGGETPTGAIPKAAAQESTTEAVPESPAAPEAPKPRPRCEALDDENRQCLYEQHSDRYPHLFEVDTPPKIAPGATGQRAQVKRQTPTTWWCPVCDNAQQIVDRAVCRKCGTIPVF